MSLGDTRLPENFGSMGSSSTLGIGSGVLIAARNLRDELAKLAGSPVEPERYPTVLADHDLDQLDASGTWLPGGSPLGELDDVSIHTFGALFAEVRIDQALCIPRVMRMVGVYSVGRVINSLTARSQMIGGMCWGLGQALLESSEIDTNLGRFVSKNLAGLRNTRAGSFRRGRNGFAGVIGRPTSGVDIPATALCVRRGRVRCRPRRCRGVVGRTRSARDRTRS